MRRHIGKDGEASYGFADGWYVRRLQLDLATIASLFGGFGAANMIGWSVSSIRHCSAMIMRDQRRCETLPSKALLVHVN
jgi:hypothetical protein